MTKIIGVRFRTAGKVYYFSPGTHEVKKGSHVIVETSRGTEYGTVVLPVTEMEDEKVTQPLKEIIRLATEDDDLRATTNREKEKDAFKTCAEKIREHGLEMKLIDAEYTFDNSKALFYFTADGRVDFRELVKDLAGIFKTRIELRQIGVRDETKIIGGLGICGRTLCCHAYLTDFLPVSIKMAKEQSLSLNPTKISGTCGRLMCCLKNEEEVYEEVNKRMPHVGDIVETPDHMEGEVAGTNVLRETVRVLIDVGDEKEVETYHLEEVKFLRKKPKKAQSPSTGSGTEGNGAGNADAGPSTGSGTEKNGSGTERNGSDPSTGSGTEGNNRNHNRNRNHHHDNNQNRDDNRNNDNKNNNRNKNRNNRNRNAGRNRNYQKNQNRKEGQPAGNAERT